MSSVSFNSTSTHVQQLSQYLKVKNQKEATQLLLAPYMGYGTSERIYFKGRVIIEKPITSEEKDTRWRNAINTFKRFDTDGVPEAFVRVNIGQNVYERITNEEGYFTIDTSLKHPLPSPTSSEDIWLNLSCTLHQSSVDTFEHPITMPGSSLLTAPQATIGIISDLDDTVIKTEVSSMTKMLYNTFFKNAHSREALKGVPALYQAFAQGHSGQCNNPMFYVSHSPWNLYDMLVEFMLINQIPVGPILLRDFSAKEGEAIVDYKQHKYDTVVRIMRSYPHLQFILIGDSAEKDTDIYREAARAFPERVAAIYIRSVQNKKKSKRVLAIAEQEDHVDIILVENSLEAAEHALAKGFINEDGLALVKAVFTPEPEDTNKA